ncbi:MAG: UDP-N-acetylmuramate--L-alanine ligase [Acutalibacteraceae bacterium]|nr:UDP-N-acetylmuramate--L-alanine ligase [Acutalibacteraceae bacterium]
MFDIDVLLKQVRRIHFIGIGGSGMCPLAEILHKEGYLLSGSDNNETDTLARIRSLGIPVTMGQKAENIKGAEMIVYTAALLPDNPELVAAKASGIPTFERSKLLGAVTRIYPNSICISGTHGKTTACSMLTQVLIEADFDPTAVIGGKLPLTGSNGIVGHSEHMVCEACEFVDTFLDLSPDIAVVLNVDEDHLDYFKTFENLKKSFTKFASMATKTIIYNGDDIHSADSVLPAAEKSGKPLITFGFNEGNDYQAVNVQLDNEFASFDLIRYGENLGRITLGIPGKHHVYNALAVTASAMESGVSFERCVKGIADFRGAGRRFEILAKIDGITVADDYAHHPKELEVTLSTAMKMGFNKVWAVFQPFTYSRTSILFDEFVRVLKIPDECIMTEIMGSREVNTYGIYTSQLAEKIPGSVWFNTFEEVAEYAVRNAEKGDLIITLGCGDIYKAAKIMIKMLEERQ